MKELNNFRKFLSENTTMPDFTIMGETFNFSDICPSAHKLVQNQAIVHQGFSNTAPTVLNFAIKHRKFFNLERKALGSMGITVDEYNDDVTRLYTEILNIADKLGVRKKAKEYMDMHMAKIKDAGFKASEPGGSSDRNFEEGYYDPTDKELDYADEIEYEQDWRDEQDDLFGKIREVRSRLENEIEGYTDLHENDVILEAFLGESNAERNPLRGIKNMFQAIIPLKLDTSTLGSLGYAKATGIKGDWNVIQFFTEYPDKYEKYKDLLSQANKFGVNINPSTNVLDAYNAISAAANEYDLREDFRHLDNKGVDFKSSKPIAWVPKEDYLSKAKFVGEWNGSAYVNMGIEYYCVIFNSKEQLHTYNYVQGHPIYGSKGNEIRVPKDYGLREESLNEKQKYADDQLKFKKGDTVYFKNVKGGKKLPMTITGPGKFMKSNRLGAGGKEIVFPVKGGPGGKGMYAASDLVKENLNEEKYMVTISKNGTTTEQNIHNTKEAADAQAKKINGGFMDRPGVKFKAVVSKDVKENLEEGSIQTFTQGLDKYTKYPHVFVFKVRTMSTDKQGGKFVHDSRYEIEEDMTFNEAVKQAEYFISLPETIGVNVNLYYTTGNTEGQLGGQVEVLRWTHDAWYMGAKSDYIKNAQANQFEDEEAERIIAIRKWLNSSSIGRQPQNVDNQEESWSTAVSSMKQKVADILATK